MKGLTIADPGLISATRQSQNQGMNTNSNTRNRSTARSKFGQVWQDVVTGQRRFDAVNRPWLAAKNRGH